MKNFVIISFWVLLAFLVFTFVNPQRIQKSSTLEEKVQKLVAWRTRKSIIKIQRDQFMEYVMKSPRNYSVIVLFTAISPGRQCRYCSVAIENYKILVNSFKVSSVFSNKLFFAWMDYDDGGQDIFTKLKIHNAPIFMHFPVNGKLDKNDVMNIERFGMSPDALAYFVRQQTNIRIPIVHPKNVSEIVAVVGFGLLSCGILYMMRSYLKLMLLNRNVLACFVLLFCIFMISGQMWNQITGGARQKGHSWIHTSSREQYLNESYLIMTLYILIVLGMILMIEAGHQPRSLKANGMSIVGILLFVITFSTFLYVFSLKLRGYGFRLLF